MIFLRPDRLWGSTRLIFNGRRGSSLGLQRLGRGVDCSPPSIAGVKNHWSRTSAPQYVTMSWTK